MFGKVMQKHALRDEVRLRDLVLFGTFVGVLLAAEPRVMGSGPVGDGAGPVLREFEAAPALRGGDGGRAVPAPAPTAPSGPRQDQPEPDDRPPHAGVGAPA